MALKVRTVLYLRRWFGMLAVDILDAVVGKENKESRCQEYRDALKLGVTVDNPVLQFLVNSGNSLDEQKRMGMYRELCLYALYKKLYLSGKRVDEFVKFFIDPEEYLWSTKERGEAVCKLDDMVKRYPGFIGSEDIYSMGKGDLELWYSAVPIDIRSGKSKQRALCGYFGFGGCHADS